MELILFVLALILLALTALRWGADSRAYTGRFLGRRGRLAKKNKTCYAH